MEKDEKEFPTPTLLHPYVTQKLPRASPACPQVAGGQYHQTV